MELDRRFKLWWQSSYECGIIQVWKKLNLNVTGAGKITQLIPVLSGKRKRWALSITSVLENIIASGCLKTMLDIGWERKCLCRLGERCLGIMPMLAGKVTPTGEAALERIKTDIYWFLRRNILIVMDMGMLGNIDLLWKRLLKGIYLRRRLYTTKMATGRITN